MKKNCSGGSIRANNKSLHGALYQVILGLPIGVQLALYLVTVEAITYDSYHDHACKPIQWAPYGSIYNRYVFSLNLHLFILVYCQSLDAC